MTQTAIVATAFLAMAAFPGLAADQPMVPAGPPPRIVVVAKVNKDGGEVIYQEAVIVPVTRTVTVVMNGQPVQISTTEYVTELRLVKLPVKADTVRDAKGNKLKEEEAWMRLAAGKAVLLAPQGIKVDPAYLAIIKDDTLILELPPPAKDKPADPAPKPPKNQ
jgi:hypothetical protein